jgi:preprotein translocase subunit SecB
MQETIMAEIAKPATPPNGATNGAQNGAPNGAAAGAQPQMKVQVMAQFIRDLSFENGLARGSLVMPAVQPDIQVQVSLDAKKREVEHHYEVTTKFKIESKNKETNAVLFLVELEYGGVFHIEGVPQDQMHPFLLIECPRILFPFARRIISDVTRDGGFPALNLDMIDFMSLYRQELLRQQQLGQNAPRPA